MELYHGDCIEVMRSIPDQSVDLVLTDPPYNIGKAGWDKIPNYVEWCGRWMKECERVLKRNGSFYWFQNDMPQIAQLMEWIRQNTGFVFNSFITWDKGDWRANAWKNPSEKINIRCWFNTCEYCLYYTFQDETGLTTVKLDTNNFPTMRQYFKDLQEWIGQGIKQVNSRLGHRKAEHAFYWNSSQWDLPTPETYRQLEDAYAIRRWAGFREYEDLRREYEDLRREYEDLRYTHNLDANHNNVWRTKQKNRSALHPCEKPQAILKRIIKTSSKPGAIVLDCFMGSGSTGVACADTGRDFIGIEMDDRYYEQAKERITYEYRQIRL